MPPVTPDRISLPERYRVVRHLANGGMASVWEAHDELLDRDVAVKILAPHLGEDGRARKRFQREARAAAGLSSHPNVVTIYDVGDFRDRVFMVMEIMRGGRARWKIENETFNVLKTKGYNIEHNFGHGKLNLAAVLATLNLIAFAIHTVCDIADNFWRDARQKLVTRRRFFSYLEAITNFLIFPSWQDLLHTLAFAKPPPLPP